MQPQDLERPELTQYLTYDELTALVHGWSRDHSRWCRVENIGQSADRRDLWLLTVGDHASDELGGVERRPAIWVDGNHHAGEVVGSSVALATVWSLIQRAEAGDDLLERTTWYVQPRVAVDGAEVYLTSPHRLRSAAIEWPGGPAMPGLHPADVNGDGWILQMRVPDEAGEWRVSDRDRRLMVRRGDQDDASAPAYRLYPEGTVAGEVTPLTVTSTRWGLDFNRSYPHNWQPEHRQSGAGPYPLYPPETRANVDAILARPNIALIVSYHTFGGFAFRLPSSAPRLAYRHADLSGDYEVLCERFSELTGGPVIQSYDDATSSARFGSLMDWAYNQHGLYGWVPELWDVWLAAGIDRRGDPAGFFAARDEDDQAALLAWNDRELGGEGFRDWTPFEHPQLGPVEIGGWRWKYTHQNPPAQFVAGIAASHIAWTDHLASCLPRLAIADLTIDDRGGDLFRVSVTVVNGSFLPTNVSQQAIDVRRADPVRVTLRLEHGEALEPAEQTLGHLAGRGSSTHRIWEDPRPARNEASARWIVRGRPRGSVVAASAKAGQVEATIDATG